MTGAAKRCSIAGAFGPDPNTIITRNRLVRSMGAGGRPMRMFTMGASVNNTDGR